MKCAYRTITVAMLAGLTLAAAYGCEPAPPQSAVDAESGARTVRALATADPSAVTVYKTATCPCCKDWVEHMRASGFTVDARDVSAAELAQIRTREGVAGDLASCHTSTVEGYVLEGHVPADLVRKLLQEDPSIRGLAVPGMPPGVPGMPEPGPDRPPYQVVAINSDGATEVYATR